MMRLFKRIPMSLNKIASAVLSLAYDQYWPSVALTQHGGITVSTLSEDSNSATITNGGAVAVTGMNNQYACFNGIDQYLTSAGDVTLNYGTGDFTIEAWILLPARPDNFRKSVISHGDSSGVGRWAMRCTTSDGSFGFAYANNSGYVDLKTNLTLPLGSWAHCVVQRSNKVFQFYVNGVKATTVSGVSGTNSTDTVGLSTSSLYIGRNSWDGVNLQFLIDSAKITKGVARYGSNFTPSKVLPYGGSDPYWGNVSFFFDVSNVMGDISPMGHYLAATGSPIIVDPASYYFTPIYCASNGYSFTHAQGAIGTGDFTFETKICPTAYNSSYSKAIYDSRPNGTNSGAYVAIQYMPTKKVCLTVNGGNLLTSNATLELGTWKHIALVRKNGVSTLYIDGNADVSHADPTSYLLGVPKVGINSNTTDPTQYNFIGYLAETELTIGVARYTANFVPPTKTLPDNRARDYYWDSTLLLMHLNDIRDEVGNAATLNGTALFSSSSQLFNANSLVLDGASDVSVSNSGSLTMTGTAWTAECFMRASSFGATPSVLMSQDNSTGTDGWQVYIDSNGSGVVVSFPGATNWKSAYTFSPGKWYHISVSRNDRKFHVAINGVMDISGSVTMRNLTNAYPVRIGASSNNSARNFFSGAIAEVRLTKGVVRYMSHFTIPVAPLPGQPNGDLYWNYLNGLFDFNYPLTSKSVYNTITNGSYALSGDAALSSDSATATQSLYVPKDAVSKAYAASDALFQFSTGDFTVEAQVRLEAPYSTSNQYVLTNGDTVQFTVRFSDSAAGNVMQVVVGADPTNVITTTATKDTFAGVWGHIAVVRKNGVISVYANGTLVGTANNVINLTAATSYIGNNKTSTATINSASVNVFGLGGNIADLRTTKAARYIGNFNPPKHNPMQWQAS